MKCTRKCGISHGTEGYPKFQHSSVCILYIVLKKLLYMINKIYNGHSSRDSHVIV